jgi:hypothetical protein
MKDIIKWDGKNIGVFIKKLEGKIRKIIKPLIHRNKIIEERKQQIKQFDQLGASSKKRLFINKIIKLFKKHKCTTWFVKNNQSHSMEGDAYRIYSEKKWVLYKTKSKKNIYFIFRVTSDPNKREIISSAWDSYLLTVREKPDVVISILCTTSKVSEAMTERAIIRFGDYGKIDKGIYKRDMTNDDLGEVKERYFCLWDKVQIPHDLDVLMAKLFNEIINIKKGSKQRTTM